MVREVWIMKDSIKVLLVDDHPVVREGLRAMLAGESGIELVGEASGGQEAVQEVASLKPDVVLMDIRMPDMSGTEATRQIKNANPTTSVIMLTMYDSEMYVVESIRAGAAGYLTKDASRELLGHAIRAVVDGGTLVRSGLLRQAIQGLLHTTDGTENGAGASLVGRLTPRELEVLRLLAKGLGNKALSKQLNIAEVTVKKHVQNVIGKLGVSDRTHAAVLAVRLGIAE